MGTAAVRAVESVAAREAEGRVGAALAGAARVAARAAGLMVERKEEGSAVGRRAAEESSRQVARVGWAAAVPLVAEVERMEEVETREARKVGTSGVAARAAVARVADSVAARAVVEEEAVRAAVARAAVRADATAGP